MVGSAVRLSSSTPPRQEIWPRFQNALSFEWPILYSFYPRGRGLSTVAERSKTESGGVDLVCRTPPPLVKCGGVLGEKERDALVSRFSIRIFLKTRGRKASRQCPIFVKRKRCHPKPTTVPAYLRTDHRVLECPGEHEYRNWLSTLGSGDCSEGTHELRD